MVSESEPEDKPRPCAYELERERTMARNKEVLAALGLGPGGDAHISTMKVRPQPSNAPRRVSHTRVTKKTATKMTATRMTRSATRTEEVPTAKKSIQSSDDDDGVDDDEDYEVDDDVNHETTNTDDDVNDVPSYKLSRPHFRTSAPRHASISVSMRQSMRARQKEMQAACLQRRRDQARASNALRRAQAQS